MPFLLFTECGFLIQTPMISQDTYFNDISQLMEVFMHTEAKTFRLQQLYMMRQVLDIQDENADPSDRKYADVFFMMRSGTLRM